MDPKEQLYKLEAHVESLEHQMAQMCKQLGMVADLITSVKVLATEMKHLRESTNNIDNRLNALEREPSDKFNHIKMTVTTCVITTVLGGILGAIIALVIK